MTPWQEKVSLGDLSFNNEKIYELDQSCPSVQSLLDELEASLEEENRGKGNLQLQLALERRSNSHYGDYLLFKGSITGLYHTPCVRCLVPAQCHLDVTFSACFLSHHHQNDEEYAETTSIYMDGEDRELYFHHQGVANLQESLHENIFMNLNPLPLHHPDCRGICPKCGINLNTDTCPHKECLNNPLKEDI